MSEAVIVAIITGAAAVIGELIISNRSAKDRDIKQAIYHEEVKHEIADLKKENSEIKKELKEHNGYAQKFVETHESIMEIRQDVALIKQDNQHIKDKIRQYHGN